MKLLYLFLGMACTVIVLLFLQFSKVSDTQKSIRPLEHSFERHGYQEDHTHEKVAVYITGVTDSTLLQAQLDSEIMYGKPDCVYFLLDKGSSDHQWDFNTIQEMEGLPGPLKFEYKKVFLLDCNLIAFAFGTKLIMFRAYNPPLRSAWDDVPTPYNNYHPQ